MDLTSLAVLAMLLAPPSPAPPGSTKWVVSGAGADMTVTLEAQKTTPPAPVVPRLRFSCRKQKAELAIVLVPGWHPVQLRYDRETAIPARTHPRDKFGGLFSNEREVVDRHITYFDKTAETVTALLSHQFLLLRSMSFGQPMLDSTFALAGLEPHLAAFERSCGLKEPLPRPAVASGAGGGKAAAPVAPPTPAVLPVERFGEWKATRTISPVDDQQIVILSLAHRPNAGAPPSRPATLVLRCRRGELDAFLDFYSPFLESLRYLPVQASVDGGASKQWWLTPTDSGHPFYFFWSGPQFLKRLLASRELRLSLGPKKRGKKDSWMPEGDLVYSLAGLDGASRALLEKCPVELAKLKVKDGLGALP